MPIQPILYPGDQIMIDRLNWSSSFQNQQITNATDVLNFLKQSLGLTYESIKDRYKGKHFCRWSLSFSKSGRVIIQARGTRKTFEVRTGYDLYSAFLTMGVV